MLPEDPRPAPIWHLPTHPRSMMLLWNEKFTTQLSVCPLNVPVTHRQVSILIRHHLHYHHYCPHDALTAGWPDYKILQTR